MEYAVFLSTTGTVSGYDKFMGNCVSVKLKAGQFNVSPLGVRRGEGGVASRKAKGNVKVTPSIPLSPRRRFSNHYAQQVNVPINLSHTRGPVSIYIPFICPAVSPGTLRIR